MPPESPTPPAETGLIIQPGAGLVTLPHGGSPALSEMICRSLAHLQTSKSLATRQPEPGEECDFEIAPGVMMRMCWIPPGEFLMGSPEGELGHTSWETQHWVTITRGFWLGKYAVIQAQWEAVMGRIPSYFKGADLPVETVSWNDISGPGGFLERANRFAATGERFALPTEAQWEYACRGGTTTALNNGKNLTSAMGSCRNLDKAAWYYKNSRAKTHQGGLKKANAWGLHDMHGNLWEWCADWFGYYPSGPVVDPQGPDSGVSRVNRGGSWNNYADGCRAAWRSFDDPSVAFADIGFRMARRVVP
jgi:formylglycine-generating enzyme required for sulfatase activity